MPWGPDVNNTVATNPYGWISLNGYLAQWTWVMAVLTSSEWYRLPERFFCHIQNHYLDTVFFPFLFFSSFFPPPPPLHSSSLLGPKRQKLFRPVTRCKHICKYYSLWHKICSQQYLSSSLIETRWSKSAYTTMYKFKICNNLQFPFSEYKADTKCCV